MNIKQIPCLLLCLAVVGYAEPSVAQQNQPILTMPNYQDTVTISADQGAFVVIRYYEPWGDGTRTGWEMPVETPTVTFDGNSIPVTLYFSVNSDSSNGGTDYLEGQMEGGFDQHAQYYVANLPTLSKSAQLTVQGNFEMVGYYSATVYYLTGSIWPVSSQLTILDRKMPVTAGLSNPYISGDPSIFAYSPDNDGANTEQARSPIRFSKNLERLLKPTTLTIPVNRSVARTGAIDLYRMDAQSSKTRIADDIAADGCSQAYLVATINLNQQFEILRMKLPKTFIRDDKNGQLFGKYQTREFSISANIKSMTSVSPILDFWTVSNRMLHDFKDSDGYAYVFFAPNDYVQQLVNEQKTPPKQPPVMTWGRYKGYVLGTPDENIVLRYRDPDPQWQGSPANATCYSTPYTSLPVTADQLGEYLPEIYSGTRKKFESGNIGVINQNQPWPTFGKR